MESANRTPKAAQADEKKTIAQVIAEFIRKHRIPLFAILAASLAVVVGVAIWTAVDVASLKASTSKIEQAETDFSAWKSEQDQTKKGELEKTLIAELDTVIAKWPRKFASQRAHAIKAKIAEGRKDWASVEKEWLAAADLLPSTYLAPVALKGAAAAAEERGDPAKAVEYYKRFADKYTGKAAGVPHAWFSLGRIAEGSGDYKGALASYEKITATWPDDDWTKLAKDRIIFINSRGLAK